MKRIFTNKIHLFFFFIISLSAHSYIFGQEAEEASSVSAEVAETFTSSNRKDLRKKNEQPVYWTTGEAEKDFPPTISLQESSSKNAFFDHVRFGGSLGASFSNGSFSGYLAPKGIYDFNSVFSAGLGILGSYTDGSNYTAWTSGASLIGLARPLPVLQLSAELEENYVSRNLEYVGADIKETYWSPALFFGIGYTTGPVTVGVRYDVLHDDQKSIYADAFMPFVSIFF